MALKCTGEGYDGKPCCTLRGERCPYLVENERGRRFACGLYLKHGSWQGVNESPEYSKNVAPVWLSMDMPYNECELFSPMFCCRREENPGFSNEREARDAGVIP